MYIKHIAVSVKSKNKTKPTNQPKHTVVCVAEAKEGVRETETERERGRQAGREAGRDRQTGRHRQRENVICYYNLSILNATVYGRDFFMEKYKYLHI